MAKILDRIAEVCEAWQGCKAPNVVSMTRKQFDKLIGELEELSYASEGDRELTLLMPEGFIGMYIVGGRQLGVRYMNVRDL